jgi:hypothetical protein
MLSIAAHAHFFIFPPQVTAPSGDGLISMFLNRYIAGLDPVLITMLYHVLVLSQALRLNYIFSDQRMFSKPTYLTAMVYVLITAIFPQWNQLTPALVANTLVIWLFSQIVNLYNNHNPKTLLFNIGLIIGGCILMYHPTTLLILIAIFALMVVRPFNVTEWLVMLMGVVAPFYFLFVFLYLSDQWVRLMQYVPLFQLNLPDVEPSPIFFATISVILLVLVVGIYHFQDKSRRMLIQVRKNWGVLMVMLLIMLPLPFISKNASLDSLLLWAIPVSPFMANGFLSPKRNTFPNIMFWTLVVLTVLNNWGLTKL